MKFHSIPFSNLSRVPEALRALANEIEASESLVTQCVVAIKYEDGRPDYAAFGREPFTKGDAAGLCHVVSYLALQGDEK